eukprot:ANDGO_00686.mRNA.1 SNF1-related protein kinase regulatory subunit beta-2
MGQNSTREAKLPRRASPQQSDQSGKRVKFPPFPPARAGTSPTPNNAPPSFDDGHSSSPSSTSRGPLTAGSPSNVAGSLGASPSLSRNPAAPSGPPSLVPTVFRWTHGGKRVYLTGTFNGWAQRIPLSRSGDDFVAILTLAEGYHHYRYIVDDEWRVDPDQPTVVDGGVVNNYVDVEEMSKVEKGKNSSKLGSNSEPEVFEQQHHRFEVSKKHPPLLPPHLRYTPLNCEPHPVDPVLLPMPQHVTLNHAYFSVVGDSADVLALGVTHRYRHKFSTVVLYKPLSNVAVSAPGGEDMILDDESLVL